MTITWKKRKEPELTETGWVYYSKSEESFYMETSLESDFSWMIGKHYVSLDVSIERSMAVGVSGLCPATSWIKTNMILPNFERGELTFQTNEVLLPGTGYQLDSSWETFYDSSSGWLKISETPLFEGDEYVEFQKGCIAELSNHELKGIVLHPLITK